MSPPQIYFDYLKSSGYSIVQNYYSYNPDSCGVYLISDSEGSEYYAKFYRDKLTLFNNYYVTWQEQKEKIKIMENLGFCPKIKELIDIDQSRGILINHKFGVEYTNLMADSTRLAVTKAIGKLHSYGYIHGDLHCGNILVDNESNVKFVDFDDCFHESDERQRINYGNSYYAHDLETAKTREYVFDCF